MVMDTTYYNSELSVDIVYPKGVSGVFEGTRRYRVVTTNYFYQN